MSSAIEDYGIIGNTHSAALVGRDGSIDWLCLPRFDGEAVFAALLGESKHGRWLIEPIERTGKSARSYRGDSGILETRIETDSGSVTIIDFMPQPEPRGQIDVIRLVRGDRGRVRMHTELVLRFDYGRSIPWVHRRFGGQNAVSGPNAIQFSSPVPLQGTPDLTTIGEFTVAAGEVVPFTLSWYPSHRKSFACRDPLDALHLTENWWHDWSAHCALGGPWRGAIIAP
jgi:GH15 family glucan-1,4-alpha-glucosidase